MALAEGTYNNSDLTQEQIDALLAEDYKGAGYSSRYIDINPTALNYTKTSTTTFTAPAEGYLVILAEMDDHYTDRILMTVYNSSWQLQIYNSACGINHSCALGCPHPKGEKMTIDAKFFKTGVMNNKIKYLRFIYSEDAASRLGN